MPEYYYKGTNKEGKKVEGKLDVPSELELRMTLRGQGIRPTKLGKVGAMNTDIVALFQGGASVPMTVLVAFTRQLQVLIGAGIPLVQGLEILAEQSSSAALKNIIIACKEKVSQGSFLWEALAAYPRVFPKLYIALVKAGEASGALDEMLQRLSNYIEDSDKVRKMVKAAMMYPIIVIFIGIGVVAAMLIFVIPKFEDMLKNAGQELPLPTKIVIDTSHFLVSNALFVFGGLGALIFFLLRFAKSEEGKATVDRIVFHLPMFGNIIQKAGVARFSRTLQTLLTSGVNLIDAIDICSATIDNAVLEEAVSKIRSELEEGKSLGAVVGRIKVFPKMASQMMAVGESTGNLDQMLEKIADFFETEVEALVGGISKLIEPFVLVFLGGTVGGIMIAMYLPIFKMAGGAE